MKAKIKSALPRPKVKIKKPNPKSAFKSFFAKHDVVIVYSFLTLVLFGGLIYLFGGKGYSNTTFTWTMILLFSLGILHAFCCVRFIEWIPRYYSRGIFGFTLSLGLLGFLLIGLSHYWSFLPELPLAYAVGLFLFIAPVFLMSAFDVYMDIPQKTWKSWSYPYGKEVPVIEVINPIKINFYIAKKIEDEDYAHFALNVPVKYKLGEFMHYFIHRYNYDKNPESPIWVSENNENEDLYTWVFRTKPHSDKDKHLLDPDFSFLELGVEEMDAIVVERYVSPEELIVEDLEQLEEPIEEESKLNEDSISGNPEKDVMQPGSAS